LIDDQRHDAHGNAGRYPHEDTDEQTRQDAQAY